MKHQLRITPASQESIMDLESAVRNTVSCVCDKGIERLSIFNERKDNTQLTIDFHSSKKKLTAISLAINCDHAETDLPFKEITDLLNEFNGGKFDVAYHVPIIYEKNPTVLSIIPEGLRTEAEYQYEVSKAVKKWVEEYEIRYFDMTEVQSFTDKRQARITKVSSDKLIPEQKLSGFRLTKKRMEEEAIANIGRTYYSFLHSEDNSGKGQMDIYAMDSYAKAGQQRKLSYWRLSLNEKTSCNPLAEQCPRIDRYYKKIMPILKSGEWKVCWQTTGEK